MDMGDLYNTFVTTDDLELLTLLFPFSTCPGVTGLYHHAQFMPSWGLNPDSSVHATRSMIELHSQPLKSV